MACAYFNPQLPHDTASEQDAWLSRWHSDILNSTCIQQSCATVCLPGNPLLGAACKACLERNQCALTLDCLNCVDRLDDFGTAYACTVPDVLTGGEVAAVVIGVVIGVILLLGIILFILYKSGRLLPIRWRISTVLTLRTTLAPHGIP